MGHVTKPIEVLQGGYLSWREADATWYQEKFFGTKPAFVKLGQFDKSFGAIRPWIDSLTLEDRTENAQTARKLSRSGSGEATA